MMTLKQRYKRDNAQYNYTANWIDLQISQSTSNVF